MTINFNKLTPAPWEVFGGPDGSPYCEEDEYWCRNQKYGWDSTLMDKNHADFIALARNAFDVMIRRGWHAQKCTESDQWFVHVGEEFYNKFFTPDNKKMFEAIYADDPFTALVKTDKWYKENVEGASQ